LVVFHLGSGDILSITGTFTLKGTNLSEDITEIWYPLNFDVIPLLNRLSKLIFFLPMDSNTCVVAFPSMIINLESIKKHLSTIK
jgi:hypothetical protein